MRLRLGLLLLAVLAAAAVALIAGSDVAYAKRKADIRSTKHNLSATLNTDPNAVKAESEDQICVFCHTPHHSNTNATPLWNREVKSSGYTTYDEKYNPGSFDAARGAETLGQPGGSSKLCLSCHDGTIALGGVNVLNGAAATISMKNTSAGAAGATTDAKMPSGKGDKTGFTRKLGTDLSNDHPISFDFNTTLVNRDTELNSPSAGGTIDNRTIGVKPLLPLENGKVQCTSCHDPHIKEDTETWEGNIKFLRAYRFQKESPGTSFDSARDQICLGCHDKAGWEESAHARSDVAKHTYTSGAATLREFPAGLPVWKAGCLNCHDTHTVEGSRRLLREGTNTNDATNSFKEGGKSAVEETCYQCHSSNGGTGMTGKRAIETGGGGDIATVPKIKEDFELTYHMPINKADEEHDIGDVLEDGGGANFLEKRDTLNKRHTECTDCHNPHRVKKNQRLDGTGATTAGTHKHDLAAGEVHSNIASGVLAGTWGVEPDYGSTITIPWGTTPTGFYVRKGNPLSGTVSESADPTTYDYVTREYQVCLKCHSNYAYQDNVVPTMTGANGGTASTVNNVRRYTNQAMEFAAPSNDSGEQNATHRSWHPVMSKTNRSASTRKASAANWLAPWSNGIGSNTMYCSDCHGSNTGAGTVDPDPGSEDGNPWGPHGSGNPFILKGSWSANTGKSYTDDLCFKCHRKEAYVLLAGSSETTYKSGFNDKRTNGCDSCSDKSNNLHLWHQSGSGARVTDWKCSWCHVAVPHGWKNRSLLVNLNDPIEITSGCTAAPSSATARNYTCGPYYMNARLRVRQWGSGVWNATNCGSSSTNGKDWMRSTCSDVWN